MNQRKTVNAEKDEKCQAAKYVLERKLTRNKQIKNVIPSLFLRSLLAQFTKNWTQKQLRPLVFSADWFFPRPFWSYLAEILATDLATLIFTPCFRWEIICLKVWQLSPRGVVGWERGGGVAPRRIESHSGRAHRKSQTTWVGEGGGLGRAEGGVTHYLADLTD